MLPRWFCTFYACFKLRLKCSAQRCWAALCLLRRELEFALDEAFDAPIACQNAGTPDCCLAGLAMPRSAVAATYSYAALGTSLISARRLPSVSWKWFIHSS